MQGLKGQHVIDPIKQNQYKLYLLPQHLKIANRQQY